MALRYINPRLLASIPLHSPATISPPSRVVCRYQAQKVHHGTLPSRRGEDLEGCRAGQDPGDTDGECRHCSLGDLHQEKSRSLLSARLFSVISPAKLGRLGASHFCEVDTRLSKVRFCALPATFTAFKVIGVFPDEPDISGLDHLSPAILQTSRPLEHVIAPECPETCWCSRGHGGWSIHHCVTASDVWGHHTVHEKQPRRQIRTGTWPHIPRILLH